MLTDKSQYYTDVRRQFGSSGFLKLNNHQIAFFSLFFINNSADTSSPNGFLVFGKILNDDFFNKLSADLGYTIRFIPISEFDREANKEEILTTLSHNKIYTEPLNQNIYLSYRLLKSFTNEPIGVLRVEQDRSIYNQSQRSAADSQFIFIGLSLTAMVAMSILAYLFFRKQDLINRSFERFVPHQFIDLLNKDHILDVALGDHIQKNISVLFMDIRNFTTISEGLTPQENFDFINTLLQKIAPIISLHNGFIDKYIGDAIMALFTGEHHVDDALTAAKISLSVIDQMNQNGAFKLNEPVKVGAGINSGEVTLGIIGAEGRLEGTVISDMVNTASRIQDLTKLYGKPILISEASYSQLANKQSLVVEYVDSVLLKGKTTKINIYAAS